MTDLAGKIKDYRTCLERVQCLYLPATGPRGGAGLRVVAYCLQCRSSIEGGYWPAPKRYSAEREILQKVQETFNCLCPSPIMRSKEDELLLDLALINNSTDTKLPLTFFVKHPHADRLESDLLDAWNRSQDGYLMSELIKPKLNRLTSPENMAHSLAYNSSFVLGFASNWLMDTVITNFVLTDHVYTTFKGPRHLVARRIREVYKLNPLQKITELFPGLDRAA